jgi:hypothetical protein
MNNSQTGKGDAVRPLSVDHTTFANNWDRIFGHPADICAYSGLPTTSSYNNLGEYNAPERN